MHKALIVGLVGLLAHTLTAADTTPQDKVAKAAKVLAEKPNYSWTATVKEGDGSPGRIGPIEGKADKAGLTYLSFEVGGIPVEVYMNGQKGTAKAMEGWQSFDELAQTSSVAAAVVRYLRSYKVPGVEAAALNAKLSDVKEAEGVFSGDLKEDMTKDLLLAMSRRREGQEPPKVANAKGAVKLWIQEGALNKYEIKVKGNITAGDQESEVDRTTTIEIKDAGTTKLELPAEAKEKML
jgi:hypothetical protein